MFILSSTTTTIINKEGAEFGSHQKLAREIKAEVLGPNPEQMEASSAKRGDGCMF